jgi:hypothetical protein
MATGTIEFKGNKYRLSGRYYRRHNWGKDGPSSLHRAIFEDAHGAIPAGFDVHHRDGDGTNNDISNLELVERCEHARQHTLERIAAGELQPPGALALRRAAEWHGSAEGLAWHSENGKRAWDKRVWHPLACQECGRAYRSPYPNKSKFCHLNCKQANLRRRSGKPVGLRPHRRKRALLSGKRVVGEQ